MGFKLANAIFACLLVLFALSADSLPAKEGINDYSGDQGCRACHSNELEIYFATAHHLTSRVPTKELSLRPDRYQLERKANTSHGANSLD